MNTSASAANIVQPVTGPATVKQTNYAHQAYLILRWGFTASPILAGFDKFLHLMTDWSMYLAPTVANLAGRIGLSAAHFMQIAGAIEVVAGLVVAFKPKYGGYLVAFWLAGIIANLFLLPGYYDVALRDFGLFLGAIALARLSQTFDV